jgi:hypothetical protein
MRQLYTDLHTNVDRHIRGRVGNILAHMASRIDVGLLRE